MPVSGRCHAADAAAQRGSPLPRSRVAVVIPVT